MRPPRPRCATLRSDAPPPPRPPTRPVRAAQLRRCVADISGRRDLFRVQPNSAVCEGAIATDVRQRLCETGLQLFLHRAFAQEIAALARQQAREGGLVIVVRAEAGAVADLRVGDQALGHLGDGERLLDLRRALAAQYVDELQEETIEVVHRRLPRPSGRARTDRRCRDGGFPPNRRRRSGCPTRSPLPREGPACSRRKS